MSNFVESRYEAGELRRNRLIVGLVAVAGVAACLVGAALTSWPWGNAIASSAVVVVFASCLWWLFASRKAGPVKLSPLSTDWLKRTFLK